MRFSLRPAGWQGLSRIGLVPLLAFSEFSIELMEFTGPMAEESKMALHFNADA